MQKGEQATSNPLYYYSYIRNHVWQWDINYPTHHRMTHLLQYTCTISNNYCLDKPMVIYTLTIRQMSRGWHTSLHWLANFIQLLFLQFRYTLTSSRLRSVGYTYMVRLDIISFVNCACTSSRTPAYKVHDAV